MSRQYEFWLDISRIWLDKFSGPIMIIMNGTKVLTFSARNLERMHDFETFYSLNLHLRLSLSDLWLSHNACGHTEF